MSAWAATTAAGKGIPGCALSVSDTLDFCMEWNAENQLKRVTLNGNEVARFAYDPLGRRVEKAASGVTTGYAYDGADVLREARGAITHKYVHGPGIDEPLAREDGTGVLTYFHTDGLGSIVKRTNQAGVVVHEYRYDVWGSIEAGASEPGYSYTGREWEPEIGLYYYRARYYDPALGRFISEDPIGFLGGLNFHAYARNNAVRYRDPYGLTIDSGIGVLRFEDIVTATGCGTPGCTRYDIDWEYFSCRRRTNGTWGFNVSVSVLILVEFSKDPSSESSDTKGMTLRQHEELHVADFLAGFSTEAFNQNVQTENYCSEAECNEGRRTFNERMTSYVKQVEAETRKRDAQ